MWWITHCQKKKRKKKTYLVADKKIRTDDENNPKNHLNIKSHLNVKIYTCCHNNKDKKNVY